MIFPLRGVGLRENAEMLHEQDCLCMTIKVDVFYNVNIVFEREPNYITHVKVFITSHYVF